MISANRSPILAIWQLHNTESQSSGVIATIIWTLHFSRSFIELHSCWNAAPILHYVLYAILLCLVNGFLSYLNLFHKIPQMCAITMLCLRKKFDTPNWASSAKKTLRSCMALYLCGSTVNKIHQNILQANKACNWNFNWNMMKFD